MKHLMLCTAGLFAVAMASNDFNLMMIDNGADENGAGGGQPAEDVNSDTGENNSDGSPSSDGASEDDGDYDGEGEDDSDDGDDEEDETD